MDIYVQGYVVGVSDSDEATEHQEEAMKEAEEDEYNDD